MIDPDLKRKVRIVSHNRTWAETCSFEVEAIRDEIAPARVFIDHVGSTAIGGLESKPIIDLLISLVHWDEADAVANALVGAGYIPGSVQDTPPRRFFEKLLHQHDAIDAVHLHLTPLESTWGSNMLVFRDALLADAELAIRYAALKHRLAADHPDDPDAYTAGKSDFVRQVLRAAAGAFDNDRLLTHQRAELNQAQNYHISSLVSQLCVAIVASISVYSNDNNTQLNFALLGFLLAGLWFALTYKQRVHRSAGDQARRVVLLASGLGEHSTSEHRMRVFDNFNVPISGKQLVREEDYFASRAAPSYRRLAELIEESAYWTRALHEASATALQWALVGVGLLMSFVLWMGLIKISIDAGVSLARVLVTLLVFLLSSDIIGSLFAHRNAAKYIGQISQRIETAAARNYPSADVLLLMSDYNAIVESAPFTLPGIYKARRIQLTKRWRAYLENKRRGTASAKASKTVKL